MTTQPIDDTADDASGTNLPRTAVKTAPRTQATAAMTSPAPTWNPSRTPRPSRPTPRPRATAPG
jgi:hypothetical protein